MNELKILWLLLFLIIVFGSIFLYFLWDNYKNLSEAHSKLHYYVCLEMAKEFVKKSQYDSLEDRVGAIQSHLNVHIRHIPKQTVAVKNETI